MLSCQKGTVVMKCSNCGSELIDGLKFCGKCGNRIEFLSQRFCSKCGNNLADGAKSCSVCGTQTTIYQSGNDNSANKTIDNRFEVYTTKNGKFKKLGSLQPNTKLVVNECYETIFTYNMGKIHSTKTGIVYPIDNEGNIYEATQKVGFIKNFIEYKKIYEPSYNVNPAYTQKQSSRSESGRKRKVIISLILAGIVVSIITIIAGAIVLSAISKNKQSLFSAETTISKEDFIASCSEIDMKAIARNPDAYYGQNFYAYVYVNNNRQYNRKTYYRTNICDIDKARKFIKWGLYSNMEQAGLVASDVFGMNLWIVDIRDQSDPNYSKILEDDVVLVYGTFNNMLVIENILTGNTTDEIVLDVKYVEFITE